MTARGQQLVEDLAAEGIPAQLARNARGLWDAAIGHKDGAPRVALTDGESGDYATTWLFENAKVFHPNCYAVRRYVHGGPSYAEASEGKGS